VAAARARHEEAAAVLAEMGHKLGAGIATLLNVFDPELIVVGGGFAGALDLLLPAARETIQRDALPPARDRVRIVPAELGEEAGMVGAGLIAFETLDGRE
jgi:glucokinase